MKKTEKLIFVMFLSISLSSQELDTDFMDSLPDDIKKDLMEQNSDKATTSKSNYKPYLYSSKLSQAEELISLKERLELDLLELEKRLNVDNDMILNEGLQLYGSDFFNTFQTSFMPINEPNPSSDYSLDVGDVISIQLIGQNNNNDDYLINRDGTITLDDIGKIVLAGLNLNEASSIIKSK